MFEVLKDLLVGFLGALLVECAPKAALLLVRFAVRAMPPELREQMLSDWTAEVLSAEGNAQKLVAALTILVSIPSIRSGHGYSPIPIDFKILNIKPAQESQTDPRKWIVTDHVIYLKYDTAKSIEGNLKFLKRKEFHYVFEQYDQVTISRRDGFLTVACKTPREFQRKRK